MALAGVRAPGWMPQWLRCDRAAVILALATTLLHLVTARGYGIFRDELYYLACAQHLDWGYVDHPPLVALLAWLVRHTLGTSLLALRLWPAVAAGILVWLTAALTRQLGGARFAQTLAGVAVALGPIYLALFSVFSMNAFDLVAWALLLLLFARILGAGPDEGRLWLVFGVVAGLGLLNKLSVLFLGVGVAAGLLAARRWDLLRDRRLWLGAGLAVLLFTPHLLWQIQHGFPVVEFVARATAYKNLALSPLAFFAQQVQQLNPLTSPLWLGGLGLLLFAPSTRPYRALGWCYPVVFALLMLRHAKPYYLAPIYPALFAAGAVGLERLTARWAFTAGIQVTAVAVLALGNAALAPLAKPLLSEDRYVAYARALGRAPGSDERRPLGRLPQFFADMHGWPQLAEAVAQVHRALPPKDQAKACVYAQNYGEAGAIDLFGPALGLPPAIAGHNSYFLWGPGACTGEILIVIGGKPEHHGIGYADVKPAGRFTCSDCLPMESDLTLYVLRQPRRTISEIWPRIKHYD